MSAASQRSTPQQVDEKESLGAVKSQVPHDQNERAALFAHLNRGVADAQAGRVVDWEELDRQVRSKYGLPRG